MTGPDETAARPTVAATVAAVAAVREQAGQVREQVADHVASVQAQVQARVQEVKPRLRGWLHLVTAPIAFVAGLLLVDSAESPAARIGTAVFAACALALFSISATVHRGRWSPRANTVFTRLDHACIFVFIAGSVTPFALLLLEGRDRVLLLTLAWGGALLGSAFRLLWTTAPRWVYTPVYLAMGWVPAVYVRDFAPAAPSVLPLLAVGGLFYTLGAVAYGLRRPNPFPRWFGFHEVFHTCTVLAFTAHFCAVTLTAAGH